MIKEKKPYNDEGIRHGWWEKYHSNGQLWYRGNYINGYVDGYYEEYYSDGILWGKGVYRNTKRIGYWVIGGRIDYQIRT